jgi:cobaltochelatase CobN
MSPISRSVTITSAALLIAISVLLLPQVVVAEYPMFHLDPERTGNVSGYAPVTGDLLWKADVGCFINGGVSIACGRVYVANRIGGSGTLGLYCLNETTGEIIWYNPIGGFGGVSTPAISGDRLFVGSYTGDLYCVNALDGGTVWNRTIEPNPAWYGVGSCPLVYEDTVFVNTASDGALFAFDFDGNELWSITTGSYAGGAAAYYLSPAAYDGKVFFGGVGPALYCVDIATHDEVWNFSTSGTISTTPAISGGMVFFATDEPGKRLHSLYLNGSEAWNTSMHCRLSSPAVSHGRVYIGDLDKHLNCLDSGNGSTIWTASVGSKIQSSDRGTLIWCYDTNQHNIAQPAVSDGILFIGSDSGYLYAFRDPPPRKGDLNHDGSITPADALVALRMAVGAVPTIDEADMNGDNKVTSLDVLVILQVAAGSINA